MIRMEWADFIGGRAGKALAATVGVFDGLHLGHRELMARVRAKAPALSSAVLTFRESPKKILRPAAYHGDLTGLERKLDGINDEGIDFCVLIDFSLDFGTLSGVAFLAALERGGVRYLAVGPDFRCGHRQDTDAKTLVSICADIGIEAEIVAPVMWAGHSVSSSRIRHAVTEGRLRDAGQMLGRPYAVDVERDSGACVPNGGECVIKPAKGLVMPPPGDYLVEIVTEQGREKTAARLAPEGLRVDRADCRKALGIVFLDTLSRECKEN